MTLVRLDFPIGAFLKLRTSMLNPTGDLSFFQQAFAYISCNGRPLVYKTRVYLHQ